MSTKGNLVQEPVTQQSGTLLHVSHFQVKGRTGTGGEGLIGKETKKGEVTFRPF